MAACTQQNDAQVPNLSIGLLERHFVGIEVFVEIELCRLRHQPSAQSGALNLIEGLISPHGD